MISRTNRDPDVWGPSAFAGNAVLRLARSVPSDSPTHGRQRWRSGTLLSRWRAVGAVFLVLLAVGNVGPARVSTHFVSAAYATGCGTDQGPDNDAITSPDSNYWGNPDTLLDHWTRHSGDFPELDVATPDKYARAAYDWAVENYFRAGVQVKYNAAKGTTWLYDAATNIFGAYTESGTTRTWFKPDAVRNQCSNQEYFDTRASGADPRTASIQPSRVESNYNPETGDETVTATVQVPPGARVVFVVADESNAVIESRACTAGTCSLPPIGIPGNTYVGLSAYVYNASQTQTLATAAWGFYSEHYCG